MQRILGPGEFLEGPLYFGMKEIGLLPGNCFCKMDKLQLKSMIQNYKKSSEILSKPCTIAHYMGL